MVGPSLYPEGGWGWAIVAACFMAEFVIFGTLKAQGVLLNSMADDFGVQLWVVGSIVSMHYAIQYALTPVAAALARHFSGRSLILIGGTLNGVGLVACAVTRSIAVFGFALVVVAGIGVAASFEMTHAELAFYFRERYPLAIVVVLTGSPVGMMLYGPTTQVLMDMYGWRGAMLLLGGVGFHLVVGGVLIRRPPGLYQVVPGDDAPADGTDSPGQPTKAAEPAKSKMSKFWKWVASALCLEVFASAEFMLVATMRMLYSIGYGGEVVYLVPNALALGLDPGEAASLTTALGAGNLAGLVLCALALDRKLTSPRAAVGLSASLTAAGLALQPLASPFPAQVAAALAVGAGTGCAVEGLMVMTRRLPFDDDKYVSVLGWQMFLGGLAASVGDTVSGWLSEATGRFHATFFLYSATMAAMLLCLLLDLIRVTAPTCAESGRQRRGLAVRMPSLFKSDSSASFKKEPIQPIDTPWATG